MFIYIYICVYSPNKRSFRGSSGVEGLDLCYRAQICVRKLASVASRGSPVASRLVNTRIKAQIRAAVMDTF